MTKYSSVFAVIVSMAVLAILNWDHYHFGWLDADNNWHESIRMQRERVKFMQDHNCSLERVVIANGKKLDYTGLRVISEHSFTVWECPGIDSRLAIYDYEQQPYEVRWEQQ